MKRTELFCEFVFKQILQLLAIKMRVHTACFCFVLHIIKITVQRLRILISGVLPISKEMQVI